MVPIKTLLPDLKELVGQLDEDLLARATENAEIEAGLREAFQQIEKGGRTAQAFEVWREDYLDQVAVAWVLACVFVRFMEDNHLIDECWLAGEKERRKLAEDTHELFFRKHPHDTDREYFHHVFHEIGKIPAAKELFAEGKTPLWAVAPSGDAAMKLLAFWQEIDAETGQLKRTFEVKEGDTRFLGDLYQELSEKAKKKYALLQTPVFVEEFILDRTLNPALDEFGLEKVRLIDPTCGSGHFLLGAFARLFRLWMKRESNEIVAAQKALDGVWGVDINPFAVAIARFRLIVAATQACAIKNLKRGHAPGWKIHLAAGDSLLFGSKPGYKGERVPLHRQGDLFEVPAIYAVEEAKAVDEILDQGFHVVVGNPPYITVKDQAPNDTYRSLYSTCYRQYSLGVPFTQRFWELAVHQGEGNGGCGYIGMITSNSFMKREFGKKLITDFFPKVELTHVIDTSGAYIPGHGTPTVILFGRSRKPTTDNVRAVLGIKGEPGTPENAAQGLVWQSIINQIDRAGSQDTFTSATDTPRTIFSSHPWSIGGGGAAGLQERIGEGGESELRSLIHDLGFGAVTRDDDVFLMSKKSAIRLGVEEKYIRSHITGENVRDWSVLQVDAALWPYNQTSLQAELTPTTNRCFWPFRRQLCDRVAYGQSQIQRGLQWFEYSMFFRNRFRSPRQIAFAAIATHNHFVHCLGSNLYNRHAPIIILPANATLDDHLELLGLLNSSTACFWGRQTFFPKGGYGAGKWEERLEWDGTKLQQFPIPNTKPLALAKQLDSLSQKYAQLLPEEQVQAATPTAVRLQAAHVESGRLRGRMIAIQEELDWQCYQLYGLMPDDLNYTGDDLPELALGERAFEIVMARQIAKGELQTAWFVRHGSKPITDLPKHWPAPYRKLVDRRIKLIETNKDIGLIERPEYKRRWNSEPWEEQEQRALKNWLLDRLEDKRYWPRIELQSTAQLADRASADAEFMQVATLYRGRPDFDLAALVAELVEGESVPFLPILRYKASGLRKREVWERTWDLQRQEDERAKQRQALEAKLKSIRTRTEKNFESDYATLKKMEADLKKEAVKVRDGFAPHIKLEDEWNGSRSLVALESEELDGEGGRGVKALGKAKKEVLDFHTSIAKKIDQALAKDDEYQAALTELDGIPDDPEIPVPPKYTTADFQKSDYWRLRGKLDVPKERWISYPHCQSVSDPSLVVGWAGWNHLEQATALVTYYDARKREGWDAKRLTPLLAGLQQLLPWIHQWHPEIDKESGKTAGQDYQSMVEQDAYELGLTLEDFRTWQPHQTTARRRTRK
jgi:hypothetical protein